MADDDFYNKPAPSPYYVGGASPAAAPATAYVPPIADDQYEAFLNDGAPAQPPQFQPQQQRAQQQRPQQQSVAAQQRAPIFTPTPVETDVRDINPFAPAPASAASGSGGGGGGGDMGGGGPADGYYDAGSTPSSANSEYRPSRDWNPDAKIWEIDYWRPLFDVNTGDVAMRLMRSLWPFSNNFFEYVEKNVDLWGPVWITLSLVFVGAATSNFSTYISALIEHTSMTFAYDFAKIPYAAALLFGYILLIPTAIYLVVKFWVDDSEIKLRLSMLVCIYGYSLFVYLPVAFLSLIPSVIVRWLVPALACALSTAFLIVNFLKPLKGHYGKGLVVIVGMAVFSVGLALAFKLYFFADLSVGDLQLPPLFAQTFGPKATPPPAREL